METASLNAPSLHRLLRNELAARHWSISRLAAEVGVKPGVASRWVTCDETKRVDPRPDKCAEIARVLELDVFDVFRAAGYLPLDDSHPDKVTEDLREAEIRVLRRRFEQILRQTPAVIWPLAMPVANVMLDQMSALFSRIEQFLKNFE